MNKRVDPDELDPLTLEKMVAGCTGKTKFDNKATAKKVAGKYGITIYKCQFCRRWHVGENSNNAGKRGGRKK